MWHVCGATSIVECLAAMLAYCGYRYKGVIKSESFAYISASAANRLLTVIVGSFVSWKETCTAEVFGIHHHIYKSFYLSVPVDVKFEELICKRASRRHSACPPDLRDSKNRIPP